MSRLLINEPPLQVLPSLAKEIGLNEAIMLQQMHYWLLKSANEFTGVKWFYKTLEEWQTEFPFWSAMTIRRTLGSLEKQKIIKIGNFNKKKFDKTKWYTIDYQRVNSRCVQNEQSMCSDCTDGCVQNEQTNTRDYQESTTENNVPKEKPLKVVWTEETNHIIDYLNKRTGKKYSVKTKKTAQLVHKLLDNGFTVEDFERVIDIKCKQWLNNEKMNQYLRPRTLFSEKFEDYLNEAPARVNQQGASGQSVADKMRELFGSEWQA
ncbi:hypothetical protein HMPREF3103_04745 [Granulicatella sp. HMSC30F09]|jgi:hypothetical protein|uniref:conserved phage C-terminal domain-containing protein n=1 Tax=Granulicatella sp. HMSC30F09 TaxID=1581071 RepID=UPI0008A661CE|nr:conserved phage C-terminal domain-containing protein [Granulicatella sp. HMSC30F09]OFT80118.1 hypothetical protein HMPREF3103_04745 [Granulicatella sp. HMSC30F09]DAR22586.1 MAG TPA: hypothetical protein [Caudoviricetes sp.]